MQDLLTNHRVKSVKAVQQKGNYFRCLNENHSITKNNSCFQFIVLIGQTVLGGSPSLDNKQITNYSITSIVCLLFQQKMR